MINGELKDSNILESAYSSFLSSVSLKIKRIQNFLYAHVTVCTRYI